MTEELYVLPASFGQRRLWLAEQAQPDTALYTMSTALRLRGELDLDVLAQSLTAVVARHEVLRTVLRLTGREVEQVVRAPEPVKVERHDVADADAALSEADRLAAVPFDLGTGPLMRCHALRITPDDHVLLLMLHHSVADGESTAVLLNELTTHYSALIAGVEPELPELPLQYADYAVWQQEQLASEALDTQLDYWRERLEGAAELRLPTARPRPARSTYAAASAPLTVPAAVVRQLQATAGAGVTAPMVALAAYAVVLSRWSGQTDVTVAVPVGGRSEVDLEPLIGFFVNTVAVRLDLSGDPSFVDLLHLVRDRSAYAYAHGDVPFEHVVEKLHPERRAGRLPIAQVMMTVQPAAASGPITLPGVVAEPVARPLRHLVFDTKLDIVERGDALTGVLIGRTELFDEDTIAAAATSVETVLRAAAISPAARVSTLDCPIALAANGSAAATTEEAAAEAGDGPATPAEHLLLRLWREVLEEPGVSVDDEFYASGGNSMRAVRIIMQAREVGVELPFEVVLGEHTIRQLAGAL